MPLLSCGVCWNTKRGENAENRPLRIGRLLALLRRVGASAMWSLLGEKRT
jgi:hypothetical protein